ncbi:hypothetical protein GWI33_016882 [Rhynchophorus ferrugineus]|uniref:Uncharacterized protein n=1 Tax=Rhynchophorus ferrugineus TaxID=354439 RepID=A0A834I086_RHYFE|nr:hypothetical protein GWI33_016882 [Rhynchophorus ferrugineus]
MNKVTHYILYFNIKIQLSLALRHWNPRPRASPTVLLSFFEFSSRTWPLGSAAGVQMPHWSFAFVPVAHARKTFQQKHAVRKVAFCATCAVAERALNSCLSNKFHL